MSNSKPAVLFVCVKNGGKSQMAGALMRHHAGNTVQVYTAGTNPGEGLNQQSIQSLAEIGVSLDGEYPKSITDDVLSRVDLVVILGSEAVIEPVPEIEIRTWDTDEPSLRGIDGAERMRLILDDIDERARRLLAEMTGRISRLDGQNGDSLSPVT